MDINILIAGAAALIAIGAHLRPKQEAAPPPPAPPAPPAPPPALPSARETMISQPGPSEIATLEAHYEALREEVAREREERVREAAKATAFREEVIGKLATIQERVRAVLPSKGGQRGSDG